MGEDEVELGLPQDSTRQSPGWSCGTVFAAFVQFVYETAILVVGLGGGGMRRRASPRQCAGTFFENCFAVCDSGRGEVTAGCILRLLRPVQHDGKRQRSLPCWGGAQLMEVSRGGSCISCINCIGIDSRVIVLHYFVTMTCGYSLGQNARRKIARNACIANCARPVQRGRRRTQIRR